MPINPKAQPEQKKGHQWVVKGFDLVQQQGGAQEQAVHEKHDDEQQKVPAGELQVYKGKKQYCRQG